MYDHIHPASVSTFSSEANEKCAPINFTIVVQMLVIRNENSFEPTENCLLQTEFRQRMGVCVGVYIIIENIKFFILKLS